MALGKPESWPWPPPQAGLTPRPLSRHATTMLGFAQPCVSALLQTTTGPLHTLFVSRGAQSKYAVDPKDLHGGQRDKCCEGSRGDGGDAIVIEGQQSH